MPEDNKVNKKIKPKIVDPSVLAFNQISEALKPIDVKYHARILASAITFMGCEKEVSDILPDFE